MARRAAPLGVVLAPVLATALAIDVAHAEPERGYFARLAAAVNAGFDAALEARAPRLVPPVPVAVAWKAARIGSFDLGAPLVALTGGDLDGDGKGELYAVTAREVIAFAVTGKKARELGRVTFAGPPAVPASRDAVGSAVVDGPALVAASSAWAAELRAGWEAPAGQGGARTLVGQPGEAGFLVCPGERLQLVPGRNHFGEPAAPVHGVRCRADLVDPEGYPLRVRAALTDTRIDVVVEKCAAGGSACQVVATHAYKDYGVAFALADVDRDGTPEVIVSGAGAPGDRDAVKVIELGGDEKRGLFRQAFNGGVAAIAVLDSDGDGKAEVVAAVRLAGATRVDLWRFN